MLPQKFRLSESASEAFWRPFPDWFRPFAGDLHSTIMCYIIVIVQGSTPLFQSGRGARVPLPPISLPTHNFKLHSTFLCLSNLPGILGTKMTLWAGVESLAGWQVQWVLKSSKLAMTVDVQLSIIIWHCVWGGAHRHAHKLQQVNKTLNTWTLLLSKTDSYYVCWSMWSSYHYSCTQMHNQPQWIPDILKPKSNNIMSMNKFYTILVLSHAADSECPEERSHGCHR